MKQVEETIEVKQTVVKYQAIDKTMFDSEEDCKTYEKTLAVILLSRLNDIRIADFNGQDWFCESEENDYITVVPKTQSDIDTLNQLWLMYKGRNSNSVEFTKEDLNTVIFVVKRLYQNTIDWLWFWRLNKAVSTATGNKYKLVPVWENQNINQ